MQGSTQPVFRKVLVALGATVTVGLALSAGTATAATPDRPGGLAATSARATCPSGDVCIYPGDNDGGDPATYYRYGAYNLSNQYGMHLIVNNQTGGAAFRLCYGYNGERCGDRRGPGSYHENLTPINSIVLER